MAQLNFDAQAFQSQQLPEPLPPQQQPQHFPPQTQNFPAWVPPPPADTGEQPVLTPEQEVHLGQYSEWLGVMDTPAKVLEHIRLLVNQRATQAQQAEKEQRKAVRIDPVERARIQDAKAQHANVVNAARIKWREAVAKRAEMLAQYDAYVKQCHDEFKRLKDMEIK